MDEISARASAPPDVQGQSVEAKAPAREAAPAVAAATEEGADEEEGAFELPPSSPATAAEAVSTSDELEDLFGELESEVQAAVDDEEVAYECPSCHGVVKEEDASCPHCQVVFEA
jgi:membrane protein involved in colicin uptake